MGYASSWIEAKELDNVRTLSPCSTEKLRDDAHIAKSVVRSLSCTMTCFSLSTPFPPMNSI